MIEVLAVRVVAWTIVLAVVGGLAIGGLFIWWFRRK